MLLKDVKRIKNRDSNVSKILNNNKMIWQNARVIQGSSDMLKIVKDEMGYTTYYIDTKPMNGLRAILNVEGTTIRASSMNGNEMYIALHVDSKLQSILKPTVTELDVVAPFLLTEELVLGTQLTIREDNLFSDNTKFAFTITEIV